MLLLFTFNKDNTLAKRFVFCLCVLILFLVHITKAAVDNWSHCFIGTAVNLHLHLCLKFPLTLWWYKLIVGFCNMSLPSTFTAVLVVRSTWLEHALLPALPPVFLDEHQVSWFQVVQGFGAWNWQCIFNLWMNNWEVGREMHNTAAWGYHTEL